MCLYDGRTYRQTYSGISSRPAVRGHLIRAVPQKASIKQVFQPILRYSIAIILYLKHNPVAIAFHIQCQILHSLCMLYCILKDIDDNLLYENCIHWYDDQLIGQIDFYLLIRISLCKFDKHRIYQLIQGYRGLYEINVSVQPRYGQQILNHTIKPLGILLYSPEHLLLLLIRKFAATLYKCRAGPVNGGKRSSKIMRHCTQQVRPHFLHLTFFLEHFLILYLACKTTGNKRYGYHNYRRCDIFRNKKIYLEIRKCKCKIHYYHADYRCQYSIHISVSEHRYQKYRKHHDGRYQYVCSKCCLYYQTQSNPYGYHH